MKERISKDVIPGVVFLTVGIVLWLLTPSQVPTTEDSVFTAQTFPYIVIAIIMICSAGLILTGIVGIIGEKKRIRKNEISEKNDGTIQKEGNTGLLLKVIGLILVSAILGETVTLLLGGILLTVGFLFLYRDRNLLHYLIVTAVVIAAYLMFRFAFGLNLP